MRQECEVCHDRADGGRAFGTRRMEPVTWRPLLAVPHAFRRTQANYGDISHNEPMEYLRSYLHDTGFVPSVVLLVVFYALLRGVRDSMWRIAVLSLPGTIAHELTHFIVGALLLAKPRVFSVWPKAVGRNWRLGSVSFGNIGLLNGVFVALAPLLLLPIAWPCLVHVLLPSFQDIRLGARSLLLYVVIGATVWWTYAQT